MHSPVNLYVVCRVLSRRTPYITFRPSAAAEYFQAMVACTNASFARDGTGVLRTAEGLTRDYVAFTSCLPALDVWIA